MMRLATLFVMCKIVSISYAEVGWPNCGEFSHLNAYPLGCKTREYDMCVWRDERCRSLICSELGAEQTEGCEFSCNEHPGFTSASYALGNNPNIVMCWCLWSDDSLCFKPNPITDLLQGMQYPTSPREIGSSLMVQESRALWGTGYEIRDEEYMPVFCYGQSNECKNLPVNFCSSDMCSNDDECFFNGYCYHIERFFYNTGSFCMRGLPSSVESPQEWKYFENIIRTSWKGLKNGMYYVITDGVVFPGQVELTWGNWDAPYTTIMELIGELVIEESQFTRYLTAQILLLGATSEEMNEITWNLIDDLIVPETDLWILCKEAVPCLTQCTKVDQYGESWSCCNHMNCFKNCPLGASGTAYWNCDTTEFKTDWPDYSGCHSSWVGNLEQMIEEGVVDSQTLVVVLDEYLDESTLFGHELKTALNFTRVSLDLLLAEQEISESTLTTQLHQTKYQTESAMRVIDKILRLDKPMDQLLVSDRIELGKEIQDVSELFGFAVTQKAAEVDRPYAMSNKLLNTHIEAQFLQVDEIGLLAQFPKMDKYGLENEIKVLAVKGAESSEANNIRLETVGTHLEMKFAEKLFAPEVNSKRDIKLRMNSGMMSMSLRNSLENANFTLGEKNIQVFEKSVIITFKHERQAKGPAYSTVNHKLHPDEKPTAIQGSATCMFWNISSGANGEWDTSGCHVVSSSQWYTVCECNHLSSFALLMDIHDFIAKNPALEILGIVCSVLSIICLALTLLIINVLNLKIGDRKSIGQHLCLCLLVGHLMALILIDKTYFNTPHEVCVIIGVTLHYVFLAVFMWMAIEGHHLYLKIIKVFDSGRDYTRIYLIVGYGVPALIVAITGIVTASLQDTGYGNDELCWLSAPGYVWAFMGPVIAVICVNLVVFALALKVTVSASRAQKKKLRSRIRVWVRGWFSLSALLGVTWLFGFLYIQLDPNFAYVFVILNGCQGVLIFLTRVVFNKQVQEAIRDQLKRKSLMEQFYGGKSSKSSNWLVKSARTSELDLSSSFVSGLKNEINKKQSGSKSQRKDGKKLATEKKEMSEVESSRVSVRDNKWNSSAALQINMTREEEILAYIPAEDYY